MGGNSTSIKNSICSPRVSKYLQKKKELFPTIDQMGGTVSVNVDDQLLLQRSIDLIQICSYNAGTYWGYYVRLNNMRAALGLLSEKSVVSLHSYLHNSFCPPITFSINSGSPINKADEVTKGNGVTKCNGVTTISNSSVSDSSTPGSPIIIGDKKGSYDFKMKNQTTPLKTCKTATIRTPRKRVLADCAFTNYIDAALWYTHKDNSESYIHILPLLRKSYARGYPYARNAIGFVLAIQYKNYPFALDEFQLCTMETNWPYARWNLAHCFIAKGRYLSAISELSLLHHYHCFITSIHKSRVHLILSKLQAIIPKSEPTNSETSPAQEAIRKQEREQLLEALPLLDPLFCDFHPESFPDI